MTDPPDEAERIQASGRGDANERVAVVATLKPGSRERAGAILAQGAPYGIDRAGFRRHSVFLAEETVVFMFEGLGIERMDATSSTTPPAPAGSRMGTAPGRDSGACAGRVLLGGRFVRVTSASSSPRKVLRAVVAWLVGRCRARDLPRGKLLPLRSPARAEPITGRASCRSKGGRGRTDPRAVDRATSAAR